MRQERKNSNLLLRAINTVVLAANVFLDLAMVVSGYGGHINPLTSSWGGIALMTFPIWAAATAAMTVVNLCWFRRAALIDIVAIAVCWGPLMDICPLNFSRPSMARIEAMGDTAFKVMTYNVYNFYGMAAKSASATVDHILREDADVVMLQESSASPSRFHNMTKEDDEALKARYPYILTDRYGLTLLSKFRAASISTGSDIDSNGSFAIARYAVEINGQTVNFFNVHMQSIGLSPDDKQLYRRLTDGKAKKEVRKIKHDLIGKLREAMRQRAMQSETVRKEIDKAAGEPVILGGDFNDVPGCFAMLKIMGGNMDDAYREAGLGPAITYHANRFYFRIDQLLCGGGVEALRVWCPTGGDSDHYPVTGYFRLGRSSQQPPPDT